MRDLAVGDVVLASGATKLRVARLDATKQPSIVYNLEVAQDHSYFVGKLRAWVHNQMHSPDQAALIALCKMAKIKSVTNIEANILLDGLMNIAVHRAMIETQRIGLEGHIFI